MMLEINNVSKRFGNSEWVLDDVSLQVGEGELVALLGESGCGKTTLLRIIAGLEEVDAGEVIIDSNIVSAKNVFVPPEKRNVGMVFQDFALFPHLSVLENIAFGLQTLNRSSRKNRVEELLEQINLIHLGDRYPHQLSGGQQQRVAVARALAPRPRILLLDEPFSSLDTRLKEDMRDEIKKILKTSGTTAVFVTHDTQDALSTADKVALLQNGKFRQYGSPNELYNLPANDYIANFMGATNCLEANCIEGGFETVFGLINSNLVNVHSGKLTLVVRPEDVDLTEVGGNDLSGTVRSIAYYGDHQKVVIENKAKQLIAKCSKNRKFKEGETLNFKISHLSVL